MAVIMYGAGDLFHILHLPLSERVNAQTGKGGKLIVTISTDYGNWR